MNETVDLGCKGCNATMSVSMESVVILGEMAKLTRKVYCQHCGHEHLVDSDMPMKAPNNVYNVGNITNSVGVAIGPGSTANVSGVMRPLNLTSLICPNCAKDFLVTRQERVSSTRRVNSAYIYSPTDHPDDKRHVVDKCPECGFTFSEGERLG